MSSYHYLLLYFFAFSVRFVFLLLAPEQYQNFGDTEEYLEVAKRLCSTGRYPFEHIFLPTFRAPGFPAFLALVSGCFSISTWWIGILLMALDSFTCVIGTGIVSKICGNAKIFRGVIFGLAYSIYPLFIQQSITIQSECLTVFLIISGIYLAIIAAEKSNILNALAGGVMIGLSMLTRPSSLILAFPVFSGAIINSHLRKLLLVISLGSALTVIPWSIYAS